MLNAKIHSYKSIRTIIGYMTEKIKAWSESDTGKDILTVIIIILVGLGSFGLGRLSKANKGSGVQIEYKTEPNTDLGANVISGVGQVSSTSQKAPKNANLRPANGSVNFFASTRGSKYYSLDCSGGKTIKEENRIYFATRQEAEASGYELSSSCR